MEGVDVSSLARASDVLLAVVERGRGKQLTGESTGADRFLRNVEEEQLTAGAASECVLYQKRVVVVNDGRVAEMFGNEVYRREVFARRELKRADPRREEDELNWDWVCCVG